MTYIPRKIEKVIQQYLKRGWSILLLGPRQTGKTTLLDQLSVDLTISFAMPDVRLQYELDVGLLINTVSTLAKQIKKKPLIIVDEIQKVPLMMDAVQYLIDKKIAQFILTGSSARKLKHGKYINLLPGRVYALDMYPLSIDEIPKEKLILEELLLYGSMPAVINFDATEDKALLLENYVATYLDDEIRLEALVRNVVHFARFLELAASESGYLVNFTKLSQLIGVAHTTIMEYYQILDDCLVAERIEPLLESKTRHKLSKSQKYIIFDLGVRRTAAKEGIKLPEKYIEHVFEQFIGLELIKYAKRQSQRTTIKYWRDLSGIEVDWVVQTPDRLIPIEVKYTEKPTMSDAKHLKIFLKEYDNATMGFLVCRVPYKKQLTDNIIILPWQELPELIDLI